MAYVLGLTGGLLGVAAGLTQVVAGSQIPEWTGSKQDSIPLGILTIALSIVAIAAASGQRRGGNSAPMRAVYAFALAGTGLLCLTTAGRVWWPSAVLLVVAGALALGSPRAAAAVLAANWMRVLLGAVGGCEWLMAAGATPVPMIIGALGGACLIAAACLIHRPRREIWPLIAVGTLPFAAVAWTAIVPLLLPIEAVVTALAIRRTS